MSKYLEKDGLIMLVETLIANINNKVSKTELANYATKEDLANIPVTEVETITLEELKAMLFSGKTAVVSDMMGIQAMLDNDEEVINITLNKDLVLSSSIIIPIGKIVTFDLNGNEIIGSTPFSVSNGELHLKNGKVISRNGDTLIARDNSKIILDNVDITSEKRNAIAATESEIIFNSGNIVS